MSQYRSSAPNVAFFDDAPPNRWDRDKFERERYSRRGEPDEREYIRIDERGPGRSHRDLEVEIRNERRAPPPPRPRVEERERDRYFEEDRYERRRPAFLDEPTPSEIANRALAPYRRRATFDRELDPLPVRRPARPVFIRRQSSLDTFDRRPLPRYGDEYRIRPDVPIPLPIRRRQSPPRRRFKEREYEEIKYKDLDDGQFEEYEDIRIKRERSRRRGSRGSRRAAASVRSSSTSSSSSFEEVDKASVSVSVKEERGKRGKTRMPKRLAERQAIIDLGYPFEEEDDFIIIRRALGKEHIDEIIELSKKIRSGGGKTIYRYEEKVEEFASPPPPPAPAEQGRIVEEVKKVTTFVEPAPTVAGSVRSPSPARSQYSHAPSTHYPRDLVEERIEESNAIGGPLTIVLPDKRPPPRSDRDIQREIASLEAERRSLQLERRSDDRRALTTRERDDYEFVERSGERTRERERDIVRVEKDRKGRMALVRSAH